MKQYHLNASQTAVWQNERAYAGSAINVISIKLHIREFPAAAVKTMADGVLRSADIFYATLNAQTPQPYFTLSDAPVTLTRLARERTAVEAFAYTENGDKTPLDKGVLYDAEVIPIREGGALLYVRFHHMLLDGYGMSMFADRVLGALQGKPIPRSVFFPAAEEPAFPEDGDFWTKTFSGADFSTGIYLGEPDGLGKSVYRETPDSSQYDRLCGFANEIGVRVSSIYAAAYAVYLAGATGKKDAVMLMPRLNRSEAERGVLGCYTLLVPVRVCVDGGDDFATVCRRTETAARQASAHKGFGFQNVLRVCREENLIADGFSEYVFNFYRYVTKSALDFTLDFSVAGAMHNHLTWNIILFDGQPRFSLDLRDGIYDDTKAGYFLDGIAEILQNGMAGKAVSEIPITGASERRRLAGVRGAQISLDPQDTIVSVLKKTVEKYAEKTAIYAGEESLSYTRLDVLSDNVAGALIERSVKGGDAVAFLLKRDARLIPAMLGILKAGAAFVPIDPQVPTDRINSILEDSQAKLLISSKEMNLAKQSFIDVDLLLTGEPLTENVPISRDQLAYIIYTSGTTGRPKGVMLAHRGIVNIVHPMNNPFNQELAKGCRGIVAVGSVGFDISLFEIFVPLMNGLFVELAPEEALTDANRLAERLAAHGADVLHCTPSRLAAYLKLPAFAKAFRQVRAVLSAGEVLFGGFADELKQTYGVKVFNGYGPTETTIGATITQAGDNQSIGRPIANTGILLLGKNNLPVPWGAPGELCIYGEGVGLGYKNLPEKTMEKFVQFEGTRIYKTGDVGRLTDDGRLLYHGRNDRLIKLRGLRIELPEIENCMASFSGVAAAACIVRKLGKSEHLIGFYTVRSGALVEQSALIRAMREKLPAYMIPDVLIELNEMPQTVSGKTDVKALEAYPVDFVRMYVAPRSKTEEILCSQFADVLEISRVGIEDSFFDLGGDSLGTTMLLMKLEEEFGSGAIDFADIYKYPTPVLLAERLRAGEQPENALVALNYDGIRELMKVSTPPGGMKTKPLGNVLLTGATGYLGVHILLDLLSRKNICGKISCLVRGKKKLSAEKRIKNALYYYGEQDFSESCGEKWQIVEGDMTQPGIFTEPFNEEINCVINAAANVAHFAHDDSLERVNTDGVKRLITFCQKNNAAFYQISTISVAGAFPAGKSVPPFTEEDLFIGQEIHNAYVLSKYLAEYAVLRAAANGGLVIKLLRVGNLQGRIRDGEFQMNMKTNAFTRQIASYVKIGAVPDSLYRSSVNFSPVDETAHMLVTLASLESGARAFHVYPPEEVPYARLFATLQTLGFPVKVLDDGEFEEYVQTLKQTDAGKKLLEGILTERPNLHYRMVSVSDRITQELLKASGEHWSPISDEYLKQYFTALSDMGMF